MKSKQNLLLVNNIKNFTYFFYLSLILSRVNLEVNFIRNNNISI